MAFGGVLLTEMLSARGVPVDSPTPIDIEYPGDVTRYGDVVVFWSNRSRINEKDLQFYVVTTRANGGTTGIIITNTPPSETVLHAITAYSDILQIFQMRQLGFNPTKHRKVPKHRILSADETKQYFEKYRIKLDDIVQKMKIDHIQLNADDPPLRQIAMKHKDYLPIPQIGTQDAIARWIGAKPGDVIEIMRNSETAGGTPYYRICVASV
jgi:DNA-directed RNA polymerase subunit H (RpoH/RPB5)